MTGSNDECEGREALEAAALALLSRVHAGDAPLDAMLALEAWEAQSDDHRAAMSRVSRAWQIAAAVDPLTITLPSDEPAPMPLRSWRRYRGWMAGAAALAASGAFVLMRTPPAPTPAPVLPTVYATTRGQTRTVELADGTRILLGAQSRIAADGDRDARRVRLLAGQALFTVAHDARRPFVVATGATTIRDIGTVFSVVRHGDATTISVVEGVVEAQGRTTYRLTAGQQVRIDRRGTGAVTMVAPAVARGWSEGRLQYRSAPLSDVLADVNRYAATPVQIADRATARLSYSGTVRVDAIDEWLGALPYAFPVTITSGPDRVQIARRAADDRASKHLRTDGP